MTRSQMNKHAEAIRPRWIEWLTGILSTLLVLSMIAWVTWEALSNATNPPDLSARVESIEPAATGWRVMIGIRNASDETAAGVRVRATLREGTAVVEEADVTFDYVAAGSVARGALLFANDPSRYRLTVSPAGFVEP